MDELYEAYDHSLQRLVGAGVRLAGLLGLEWRGASALVPASCRPVLARAAFRDEYVVNLGFDEGCRGLRRGGGWMSRLQSGRVQNYLRVIGVALVALLLFLIWGCGAS